MPLVLTPQNSASRLVRIAEAFSNAHGNSQFPVDIIQLALGAAEIFQWSDPISEIKGADISGFEGALFPDESKKKWMLLYNDSIRSPGRVRFTQAHELGHYVLHRTLRDSFQCADSDMLNWSKDDKDIEGQADLFASYLLMPLDDYRSQSNSEITLDLMGHCADRYGVSLTAAILKWLDSTEEKAVVIISTDGYMNWAWSSDAAWKAGAFFKTRNNIIELPAGSLAANLAVRNDRVGSNMAGRVWFKHADAEMYLREMKMQAEQYGHVLTLLHLPNVATVWPPRDTDW